ncbi:IS66 family insertion sequence element accessory protein TnpB [Jannaschia sp. CCS1]|uniref:IS66 family insertion sequence element accessory protein TnpB n=1 Tax=Jannaschia sp. (strain CCS1) TaxID=290400 RepID=UPI0035291FAC
MTVVSCAKRGDRITVPPLDGSGLVMWCNRLESDSFAWPKITDRLSRSKSHSPRIKKILAHIFPAFRPIAAGCEIHIVRDLNSVAGRS